MRQVVALFFLLATSILIVTAVHLGETGDFGAEEMFDAGQPVANTGTNDPDDSLLLDQDNELVEVSAAETVMAIENFRLEPLALPYLDVTSTVPVMPGSGDMRLLEDRFRNEPVDEQWAQLMEPLVYSVVSAAAGSSFDISEVKCRTTVCEALIVQRNPENTAAIENNRDYLAEARQLFSESFASILAVETNRVSALEVFEMSPVGGRRAIRFWLYGPSDREVQ